MPYLSGPLREKKIIIGELDSHKNKSLAFKAFFNIHCPKMMQSDVGPQSGDIQWLSLSLHNLS